MKQRLPLPAHYQLICLAWCRGGLTIFFNIWKIETEEGFRHEPFTEVSESTQFYATRFFFFHYSLFSCNFDDKLNPQIITGLLFYSYLGIHRDQVRILVFDNKLKFTLPSSKDIDQLLLITQVWTHEVRYGHCVLLSQVWTDLGAVVAQSSERPQNFFFFTQMTRSCL